MGFWAIAAPIIGGLLGKGAQRADERRARIAQEQQNELYATTTIQKRVEDAKAAGLHPLFALGAQPYTPAPLPVGGGGDPFGGTDMASVGKMLDEYLAKGKQQGEVYPVDAPGMVEVPAYTDMGPDAEDGSGSRYVASGTRLVTPAEAKPYYEADFVKRSAEEAEARAALTRLQINKEAMALGVEPSVQDAVNYVPDEVIRGGKGGATAGVHPGWKRWNMGDGMTVWLPWSDEGVAESIEGLPQYMYAAIAAKNAKELGQDWKKYVPDWILRKLGFE